MGSLKLTKQWAHFSSVILLALEHAFLAKHAQWPDFLADIHQYWDTRDMHREEENLIQGCNYSAQYIPYEQTNILKANCKSANQYLF